MKSKNVVVVESQLTGQKEFIAIPREGAGVIKIKVKAGHRYMVYEQVVQEIPQDAEMVQKMRLQRVGRNLKLLLGDDPTELILEDYFSVFDGSTGEGLFGRDAAGQLQPYLAAEGTQGLEIATLEDGGAPLFYELVARDVVAAPAIATAAFAFGPLGAVVGGVALAAGAASSGGKDETEPEAAKPDITPPASPTVALVCDTGTNASDKVTADGRLNVSNVESGGTVQYSTDSGATWTTTFAAKDGVNNVKVRVVDAAKNASLATDFSFTLIANTVSTPSVELSNDTGTSATDRITADGRLEVSNVQKDATVQYSTDGGVNWVATFNATEGLNNVKVRAVDVNNSASSAVDVSFTLDKSAPAAPTLSLVCDSGISSSDKISKTGALKVTTAETGGTVQYSVDGTNWASTVTAAEGLNNVKVRVVDTAGNSGLSTDYSFTLDTTAPVAPVLALASDTGRLGTDNISQDGTLSVSHSETGVTFQYSTNGASWGTTLAPAEGNHTVQVRAIDAAGNVGSASELKFTVDKTIAKPTVSLQCDSGIVGDKITAQGAVLVADVETGAVVQYSRDSTVWSTTFTATEGANKVFVRVMDAAGNVATSDALEFTLNTKGETFTARLDNASNSGSVSDNLTNDDTPTISGTGKFGDTVSVTMPAPADGSAAEVVTATVDSNNLWTATASKPILSGSAQVVYTAASNAQTGNATVSIVIDKTISRPTLALLCDSGSSGTDKVTKDGTLNVSAPDADAVLEYSTNGLSWTSTYVAVDGLNKLRVRAVDNAGNVATSSELSFTLDRAAPTPTLSMDPVTGDSQIGPADAAKVKTVLTGKTAQTQAGDTVTLSINKVEYRGTVDAFGIYSIEVNTSDLVADPDKTIDARVTAVDLAGNSGNSSSTHAYSVDARAPTVQSIEVNKTALKIGETATVTITFSEKVKGLDLTDLVAENGAISALSSKDGGTTWTATLTPTVNLEDATNVVSVKDASYTDEAGNPGGTGSSSNYAIDTKAPSFTVKLDDASNSGSLNDTLTNDTTPTISGTGTVGDTIKVTMPGTNEERTTTVGAGGTWNVTATQAITSGVVKVIATDPAGNTSPEQTLSLTIDATAPSAVIVALSSDTGSSASDKVTQDGAISVTAEAGTTMHYSTDGGATWSTTFGAQEGANKVVVRSTDAAGNSTSSSELRFTLDTTSPTGTITVNAITGDDAVGPADAAEDTTRITGTTTGARAGDEVTLVLNGNEYTGTVDVAGEYSIDVDTADLVADGDKTLAAVVKATNMAGQTTQAQATQTYSVDTSAPTVQSVVLDKSSLKAGQTATVTITFSEKVASFDSSDVTVDNGTLGTLTTADDGKTWTGTYTPSANVEDTTNVVSVLSSYTDVAGNPGAAGTSSNYTLDTKAPTAIITLAKESLKAGETTTVTVTFSEAVQGFDNSDATAENGNLGTFTSADGGKTWTASFTPNVNVEDATNVITLANSYTDAVGNTGTAGASGNYAVDTLAPSGSITLTDVDGDPVSNFTAGQSATVAVSFNEAVKDFSNADVVVENGTLSPLSSSDGGKTWTGTYTANSNVEDATNTISVNASGYGDVSGNLGGVVSSANYAVDTQGPTASIVLSDSNLLAGEKATVTITFSEKVTEFSNADVTVENGTLSTLSSTDGGKTWTGTFTPTAGVADATNVVSLANAYADQAGNQGSAAVSANYAIDQQAPTATISISDTALKAGETATVAVTFSEKVQGFSNADVSAPNGTLSEFVASADGLVWTATFTPTNSVQSASNAISLAVSYADESGNAGTTASSVNYSVNTSRPTFTVALDESSNSGKTDDLVTNDATPTLVGTGTTGHTITVTMPGTNEVLTTTVDADGEWQVTPSLAIASGSVTIQATDTHGNDSPAQTLALVIDQSIGPVTVSLTCDSGASGTDKISQDGAISVAADANTVLSYSTDSGATWGTTFGAIDGANKVLVRATDLAGNTATSSELSFTQDKHLAAFTVALVCDSGSSASDAITRDARLNLSGVEADANAKVEYSTDGTSWKNVFEPVNGANAVQVRVTDLAGNSRTQSLNFNYDNTAPETVTVALACDSGASATDKVTKDDALAMTAEAGATMHYSTDGGATWSTTFGAQDGENKVIVRATDTAGNSTSSSELRFTLDTTTPTATITVNAITGDDAVGPADAAEDTTRITGTTTGARAGDEVTLVLNGNEYTGTVDVAGEYSIDVDTADLVADGDKTLAAVVKATNMAGQTTQAQATQTYSVDTSAPTVQSVVLDKSSLKAGQTATVTITFSEKVASFDSSDVTVDNGTLGTLTTADSGKTWTGTYTPSANVEDTTNVVSVLSSYTDVAGNPGAAGTSSNYTLDTKAPTAIITLAKESLKAGETTTVTVTFSEAVQGFDNSDVTVQNGTLGTFTSADSGKTWSATFTPDVNVEDATNVIALANSYTDAVGNTGTAGTSGNYAVDTLVASGTIVLKDGSNNPVSSFTAGQSAAVTITFSEAVKDFSNADVVADNGTLSVLSSADGGKTWAGTFTANANVEDATNTISVSPGAYSDLAGNAGAAVASGNYTIDTQGPTATIALSKSSLLANETATVTITFSEKVTEFSNADVSVENGTLSMLSSTDGGKTWIGTFTPTAGVADATNVVSITNGYTDLAGNQGSSAVSANYLIDQQAPTATISLSDSQLKAGETTTVSITFSEKVLGFSKADVTAPNGSLTDFVASADGLIWTATFTPDADLDAPSNTLSLANTYTDESGNTGTAATATYAISTKAPTFTVVLDTSSNSGATDDLLTNDATPKISGTGTTGNTITVTMPGTGEVLTTTVLANGTWSVEPTLAISSGAVSIKATDSGGNTSPPQTLNLVIDTTNTGVSVALNCDSGSSASDKISKDGTLKVTADADTTLTYSSDGGSTWSTTFNAVEGANAVLVRATDRANNVVTSSPLNFTLDTQLTAFTVALSCDSGTSSSDKVSNDARLTLSGVDADAVLEYSTDGTTWGSTYAPLEGLNAVKVRVTDAAGNQRTQDYSFTFDSTKSTAPVIALVCDSGSSTTDGITRDGVINVTAESGASLEYSTNGTTWATSFAAADGSNTVYARVTDKAGNVSNTSSLNFTIDTTGPAAPTVSLLCDSGSSSSDHVSKTGTLKIEASESGLIEYSSNGSSWGTSFTPTEGLNNVKVRVTDLAGNVGAVTDYSFTLDTTAPAAPTFGLVCDSGTSASDLITRDGAIQASSLEAGVSFQYSTNGTTWTTTFTAVEGSNTVKARVIDAAGNVSEATELSFTLDREISKPGVALSCDTGTVGDLITSNGQISTLNVKAGDTVEYSRDSNNWFTTFTAVEGSNQVFVRVSDAAGNTATSDKLEFTLSTMAGTFTARLDNSSNSGSVLDTLTNDDTPTISGSGKVGHEVTVTMPGTNEKMVTTVDSNGLWSVTPTQAITTGVVNVSHKDIASGVTNTATVNITIDKTIGSVTVGLQCDTGASGTDSITNDGRITVTGVDSDAVAQFSTDNGVTWTTTFTASEGLNNLQVRQLDTAGNISPVSALAFTLDTLKPSSTITLNAITGDDAMGPADAAKDTTRITGTTTGARAGDEAILVLNGNEYTGTVDVAGGYSIDVDTVDLIADDDKTLAAVVTGSDLAGNLVEAQASRVYSVDTSAPTVQSVVLDKSSLKAGQTATVTITFSEKVASFDSSDVTVDNGTLGTLTTADDGKTWTGTYTPSANVEDTTNVVSVLSSYTDVAGNPGAAGTSSNYTLDTKAPTAIITLAKESLKAGETTTVTVTFSEAVQGFDNSDATAENGNLGTFTSADGGKTWTASFTPNVNVEDATNVITLANSYTDAVGNTGTAGASGNYAVDTLAPSGSITLTDVDGDPVSNFTAGQSATVAVSFNEAVKDFSNADVVVENGTLSPLSSSDGGKTWTGTYTANSNVEDATNTVSISANGYSDLAGNAGGVIASDTYAIDTKGPSGTVSMSKTNLLAGDTATVTIAFNEKVTAFDNTDVTVENGTLGTLSTTDGGQTWTATFTPDTGVADATNVVSVANGYTDLAGNQGSAISSPNYAIDQKAPTTTISLSDNALKAGEAATVTVVFSEKVLGFSKSDVTAPNGVLSDFVASADGLTWTATFTPDESVEVASNTLSLAASYTDESGNPGTAATAAVTYAIDTKAPTITAKLDDASNTGSTADLITSDATPTISGAGSTGDTITVTMPGTNEVLSTTVGADGKWSVTPTLAIASGNVTVSATDAAGNASNTATLALVIDDTINPIAVALTCDSGASASDKVSSSGAITVNADTDATLSYSTDSGTTWSTTFSAVEGANKVMVRGVDVAGKTTTSTELNFTLDTQMAAFAVALSCDSGESSTDRITKDGTVVLSGAEAGAKVEYSTNSGSTWSNTFAAQEGSNTVQVRVTDLAGNQLEKGLTFTYDSTKPIAPVITLAQDSGSSATDKITNTGLLSTTFEAGGTLEFSTDGTTWTAAFTAKEGTNTVFARVIDKAGNTSPAGSLNFTLDTTVPVAPTVALLCDSGTAADKISNQAGLVVSTEEQNAVVEFSTNGVSWATTFTASEGLNIAKVRVVDAAGNIGAITDFSFTRDTTAPDAPALGLVCDSGSSGSDKISNDGRIVASTLETGATVQYSTNDTSWGTTFTPGEGLNTVFARVIDAAGNPGASSKLEFTLDTTLTTPTITLECDTGSPGDNITFDPKIKVQGVDANTTLEYSTNGTVFNATFVPVSGENTVHVRVTDVAGNVKTTQAFNFVYDAVAPSPSITLACDSGRSATDLYTKDGKLTVSGVLSTDQVEYSTNGTTWGNTFFAGEGANTVTIRVTDGAGKTGLSNTLNFTLDTQIEEVAVALDCDSGIKTNDRVTAVADLDVDMDAVEEGSTVSYKIELADETLVKDWSSNYTAPTSNGDYVVSVRTVDKAGNETISTLDFTLITSTPAAGTLSLVSDTGRTSNFTDDRITSDGRVKGSVSYGEGYTVKYEFSTNGGTSWSTPNVTFFPTIDGAYQVRRIVTDAVDNSATSAPLLFTLDTTAPTKPGVSLFCDAGADDDNLTNNGRIELSGIESNALVEFSANQGGTWSTTFAAVDGANTLWVRQTDVTGNISEVTTFNFTLDTSTPTPVVSLFCDTGVSNSDWITNDARLFVDSVEAGAALQYNLDNAGWVDEYDRPTEDGNYNLKVRAVDPFGNVSEVVNKDFTLDVTPVSIVSISSPSTQYVTGASLGDSIDIVMELSEVVQAGSSLRVQLDSGATVLLSAESEGSTLTGTYLVGDKQSSADLTVVGLSHVSLTDIAGNTATEGQLPSGANLGDNNNIPIRWTLLGTDDADVLNGLSRGPGFDDDIYGKLGDDTVDYSGSDTVAVNINLAEGTVTGANAAAVADRLFSIENAIGGAGADTITGSDEANVLDGGLGNDTLLSGAGNDTLISNAGADLINGGDGIDWIDYSRGQAATGVSGTLAGAGNAVVADGTGSSDSLSNIENVRGSAFADNIGGDALDNILVGGDGADTLSGGAGNDSLRGDEGDDRLLGGLGDDTMWGGAGNDSFVGGGGNDWADYSQDNGGVNVSLNASLAVDGWGGNDTLSGVPNVLGTSFNDVMQGDTLANHLKGDGGNDSLYGFGGADTLEGGAGDDTLVGFGGAQLRGGEGSDWADYGFVTVTSGVQLDLNAGRATVAGLVDTLEAIENVYGSASNDRIVGDGADNVLIGGGGNDTLLAGAGNDTIVMTGQDSTALIDAGAGNDVLDISGQGLVLAGDGDDLVNLLDMKGDFSGFTVQGGSGVDTLSLDGYGTKYVLTQTDPNTGEKVLGAISGFEVIDLGNRLNVLDLGSDSLNIEAITGQTGQAAVLRINGSSGSVFLPDGFGIQDSNDDDLVDTTVVGGITYEMYVNTVSGGNDTVLVQQGVTAVYTIVLTDETDPLWTGTDLPDFVNAKAGNDTLFGAGGDDTLRGGAGDDSLNGGLGNDWADYTANVGDVASLPVTVNLITGLATGAMGTDTLVSIENVLGGGGNDLILGDSLNNWLMGADGNDTLNGGAGNDTLTGGKGNDQLIGGADNDWADYSSATGWVRVTLNGGTNATLTSFNEGTDTLNGIENVIGGVGNDTLSGDALNNHLIGGGGNDSLLGQAGNDTLEGGSGSDWLDGGTGADLFFIEAGNDTYVGGDGSGAFADTLDLSAYNGKISAIGNARGDFPQLVITSDVSYGTDVARQIDVWKFGNGDVTFNSIANSPTDNVAGVAWAETILTGNGNDSIVSANGSDFISTGAGNDTVNPGAATGNLTTDNDTVDGGAGEDWLNYTGTSTAITTTLDGGAGSTFQRVNFAGGTVGFDLVRGFEHIITGNGADSITGSALSESIIAGNGADTVRAGEGNNYVDVAGTDNAADRVFAGMGNDTVYMGRGVDLVSITGGNNLVHMTPTNGSFELDTVFTGAGDDTVIGYSGSYYFGGWNGQAPAVLNAGDGNNYLAGMDWFEGAESVITGSGNDFIDVGRNDRGDDTVFSGAGNDTVYIGGGTWNTQQANLGDGDDWLLGTTGNMSILGGNGHDTIALGVGTHTVIGGQGNDSIVTGAGNDRIWGDDSTGSTGGNDTIDAGAGINTVYGGAGDDYILGSGSGTLLGEGGNDTIVSMDAINLINGGDGDDLLRQIGLFAQTILAGAGNDTILTSGSTGTESLFGGAGNDFIDARNGGISFGDVIYGDNPALSDTINIGNDTIYTSDANNTVFGGGGNDWVWGGSGNDNIQGNEGADSLYGNAGNDTLLGNAGADWLDGGSGNDSLLGGTEDNARDSLYGGAGNDWLDGGTGDDWLDGGAGDDTIYGGEGAVTTAMGNDSIVIGAGANRAYGQAGSDVFIYDSAWANDGAADTIDGGASFDVIKFDLTGGLVLDLTSSSWGNANAVSIDGIDITGQGNNGLKLAREDIVELTDVLDVNNTTMNMRAKLLIDGDAGDALDLSGLNASLVKVTSGGLTFDFNGNGFLDASEQGTIQADGTVTFNTVLNGTQTYNVFNVSNTVGSVTTNYGLLIVDTDIVITGI